MIVLLSCSTSWCQNDNATISSTGELTASHDSVLIAFDDLRKANAKMVELKYEKEINDSLRSIIKNDDIIMREYSLRNKLNKLRDNVISLLGEEYSPRYPWLYSQYSNKNGTDC